MFHLELFIPIILLLQVMLDRRLILVDDLLLSFQLDDIFFHPGDGSLGSPVADPRGCTGGTCTPLPLIFTRSPARLA